MNAQQPPRAVTPARAVALSFQCLPNELLGTDACGSSNMRFFAFSLRQQSAKVSSGPGALERCLRSDQGGNSRHYMLRQFFTLLTAFATATGCSVQAVQHPKKLSGRLLTERLKSSYGVLTAPDVTDYLARITVNLAGGHPSDVPSPIVLDTRKPIAIAAEQDQYLISSGLLCELDNEGELAFIIAHELAHLQLGHLERTAENTEQQLAQETAADSSAVHAVLAAGYSGTSALTALSRTYQAYGYYSPVFGDDLGRIRYTRIAAQLTSRPSALIGVSERRQFTRLRSALHCVNNTEE